VRIIDVDSHFYEPLDWLGENFPDLARQLPPPSITDFIFKFVASDVLQAIPPEQQLEDPMDLFPDLRGFLGSLPSPETLMKMYEKDRAVSHPEERIELCDDQGIELQFINSNWAHMPYIQAQEMGRPDLALQVLAAYNTWAGERLHGYTDRLVPITFLDLRDPDWALRELSRMREAGSRAFGIKPAPPSADRSLTHPDLEPVWSAAEDLGMVAIFHTGPSGPAQLNPGWLANGGEPTTFALLNLVQGPAVKLALAALIFDGVFERHPRLAVLVEELGISWLPEFLARIDQLAKGRGRAPYTLPLLPSEYIARQVRVAALATTDKLYPILDQVPEGLIVYSTDYPHPEGSPKPFEIFSEQLAEASNTVREQFFYGSAAEVLNL
jgi:predicted TIM-barrel fold metal-dependent hydrolase